MKNSIEFVSGDFEFLILPGEDTPAFIVRRKKRDAKLKEGSGDLSEVCHEIAFGGSVVRSERLSIRTFLEECDREWQSVFTSSRAISTRESLLYFDFDAASSDRLGRVWSRIELVRQANGSDYVRFVSEDSNVVFVPIQASDLEVQASKRVMFRMKAQDLKKLDELAEAVFSPLE